MGRDRTARIGMSQEVQPDDLPRQIRDIKVSGSTLARLMEKMDRWAAGLDRLTRPRMAFMTCGLARKIASGTGIILAIATIVFGFVPLMDVALMMPIVFFGLGICTGDGLVTSIGWLVLSGCLGVTALISGVL